MLGFECLQRNHVGLLVVTRVLDHAEHGPERADGLVVFLPGFGDDGGVFERYGLVDIVHEQTRFDALGAHAHFGFYRDFSVLPRLESDVVGPALAFTVPSEWRRVSTEAPKESEHTQPPDSAQSASSQTHPRHEEAAKEEVDECVVLGHTPAVIDIDEE